MTDTIQSLYDKFTAKKDLAEKQQYILNLDFARNALTSEMVIDEMPKNGPEVTHHVGQNYMPKNGFFN